MDAPWDAPPLWSTPLGHYVYDLAFSLDNKLVAAACRDSTVALLDRGNGSVLRKFKGHDGYVYAVVLARGSRRAASAGSGNAFTVLVWNLDSLAILVQLRGHSATVYGLSWAPDGRLLASASGDKTVIVWDAVSGNRLHTLRGHSNMVTGVKFSEDSHTLLTCGNDKRTIVWDMRSGKQMAVLECTDLAKSAAFDDKHKTVITVSEDRNVQVWDSHGWRELRRFAAGNVNKIYRADFSSDCTYLVTVDGPEPASVRLTEVASGFEVCILADNLQALYAVAFSSDCLHVGTGGFSKTASLWALPTQIKKPPTNSHGDPFPPVPVPMRLAPPAQVSQPDHPTNFGEPEGITPPVVISQNVSTHAQPGLMHLKPAAKNNADVQPPENSHQIDANVDAQGINVSGQSSNEMPDVSKYPTWYVDDVCAWLKHLNLTAATMRIFRQELIQGFILPELLSHETLRDLGVSAFGERVVIIRAIHQVVDKPAESGPPAMTVALNRADVVLAERLSGGNFGEVFRGTYKGAQVVIKKPNTTSKNMLDDFLEEAKLMKNIPPHPNVVPYFGVCSTDQELLLVIEFCPYGSLEDYLRRNPTLAVKTRLHIATEVAAGMAHLSAFIVHRDLATRNILLSYGGPPHNVTAKVADFGLSRPLNAHGYYRLTMRHPIPLPWSPNEIYETHGLPPNQQNPHSPASDVWMFATTVWEMFSEIPQNNHCVPDPDRSKVPPLSQPAIMPASLYELLTRCWAIKPQNRPTFETVHRELIALTGSFSAESRHVMLSYQWDSQTQVLEIKKRLERVGFSVWMDVDKMYGNLHDAMAKAVLGAAVVCPFVTPAYQTSPNCRQELALASVNQRPIVPIMLVPDGKILLDDWINILLVGKVYYDMSTPNAMERNWTRFEHDVRKHYVAQSHT